MVVIHKRAKRSKREVVRMLSAIGPALTGQSKYAARSIRSAFFAAASRSFFSNWYDASISKSDGVADEFGNQWKPISERTRIYRPLSSAERSTYRISKKGYSLGLLTEKEHQEWKLIFARSFARLSLYMSDAEAKVRAGKMAWSVMKKKGARTKKATFRNRDGRILYISGRLLGSLRPSDIGGGYYRPNKDQKAEYVGAEITYGTKVPYAEKATKGRPLVPEQYQVWVGRAVRKGIEETIKKVIGEIQ